MYPKVDHLSFQIGLPQMKYKMASFPQPPLIYRCYINVSLSPVLLVIPINTGCNHTTNTFNHLTIVKKNPGSQGPRNKPMVNYSIQGTFFCSVWDFVVNFSDGIYNKWFWSMKNGWQLIKCCARCVNRSNHQLLTPVKSSSLA